jgi:general secretion pathway protein H
MRRVAPLRAARPAAGFTLIEILVVMLLLVIVIGMVGLSVSGDEHRAVREESDRLSVLLHAVQQEAILQGKVYAVELGLDGYEFQILGQDGKFQSLAQTDDMLRPRSLPPAMEIRAVTIEGAPAGEASRIVFYPTGEAPVFSVSFVQNNARWRVEGKLNGSIRSAGPDA